VVWFKPYADTPPPLLLNNEIDTLRLAHEIQERQGLVFDMRKIRAMRKFN
jgi:hypothetical protein